jgi:outer membrane protein assembly factor BamB
MLSRPLLVFLVGVCVCAQDVDVLTQHNDAARTGANLRETILTKANVRTATFGKLFDIPVQGQVYAQPLVVTKLNIGGRSRTVLYVATAHNMVYAFDGDTGEELWSRNVGPSMPTPSTFFPSSGGAVPYRDMTPEIGITATPVIDRDTNTMYFTSFEQRNAASVTWHHMLHAVDLATGDEKYSGPVEIDACLDSPVAIDVHHGKVHRGRHAITAQVCFDPFQHLQRPALLLAKRPGALGQVIMAFASHADYPVFRGWVLSYQADNLTKQLGAWVSNTDNSPDGNGAGIWQSGMGPAMDEQGNFFFMTGNGAQDGKTAFGESFLRFSTDNNTIKLSGYFTACNKAGLDKVDEDLGSSGPLLIDDSSLAPRPGLVIGGGKQGRIYVFNKDGLPGGPATCKPDGTDPGVPQEFQATFATPGIHSQHIHGTPVYRRAAACSGTSMTACGPVIYVWGETDVLRAYPLTQSNGQWRFNPKPPAWAMGKETSPLQPWTDQRWMMTGGMLSISAYGEKDAIVWATTPLNGDANSKAVPGILHAYDADDLQNELWNSYQDPEKDDFGNYSKFTPVTVANGKVYVPTFSNRISVYGLRRRVDAPVRVNLVMNNSFEDGSSMWTAAGDRFTVQPSYAYSGKASGMLCVTVGSEIKALFHKPDVCPASLLGKPARAERISQVVTAPKSGRYTVTARCATNILSNNPHITDGAVELGVLLNGRLMNKQTVAANSGYLTYSVDFDASQSDKIEVWYSAPKAKIDGPRQRSLITPEAWAVIDDVRLVAH